MGGPLDLAHIEARQGKDLKRQPCRLGPLVETALALPAFAEAGVAARPTMRLTPGQAVSSLDAGKTVPVCAQVLSNALRCSGPASEVRSDTLHGEWFGGPAVGRRVTDQGIGMTPEQSARVCARICARVCERVCERVCKRVCEHCSRADPSGPLPGTGLGMSVTKEITELQGGRIDIHSEPGRGTDVTLRWPLHTAGVPAAS